MSGMLDNRSLLQKADLALADLLADGGLLEPAHAMKFIRLMIDDAVIMKLATVKPMKAQKDKIDKIQFGAPILRAGSEATALPEADRAKPTTSDVELDAKLFKAEVRLSNEVLEDSIERNSLKQTVMQLMAERLSTDMDDTIVNSDTASATPRLAQFDGLLKQATTNIVDAAGSKLTRSVLRDTLRTMPTEFRKNKKALRYLTSSNAEIDYRDSLADRGTDLGDRMVQSEAPVGYSGIGVLDVPLFPEDLTGGADKTNVILADPKNLTVGIWRQIRLETDKLISEGVMLIVATMRFDFKYAHEPAVVKAINVQVG